MGAEEKQKKYDPLLLWEDHEACWKMQFRGSLGNVDVDCQSCMICMISNINKILVNLQLIICFIFGCQSINYKELVS